jgi:hypothetical protein
MKEIFHAVLIIIAVYAIFLVLVAVVDLIAKIFKAFESPEAKEADSSASKPDDDSGPTKAVPVIHLGGVASTPAAQRLTKFELTVEYNARLAGSSYFIVRVRGGPDGGRVGGITYALSCTVNEGARKYMLGDRRSAVINPDPFKGLYVLNSALPSDDSWATLAVIPLEHVLPPRGVTARYEFKCLAYASAGRDYVGPPNPVGHVLAGVEYATFLSLPGPGYVDELDWLILREKLIGLLVGLLQGCVNDVSDKTSKVRSMVDAIDTPASSDTRRTMLKTSILRAYLSALPSVDLSVLDEVRMSNDPVLVEAVARLVFQLACREPLISDIHKAFAKIKATYDVNVNGYNVRLIDPLPPVAPVKTPTPAPKPSPAVPSFELKLEPIEEAGRMKAAEVYVRGFAGSLLVSQPELSFWLWDETSGDTPFLMSADDIDHVHERALHVRSWKSGEYDPNKWQKAGMIMFNQVMPPSGGARRISVAGRLGAGTIFSVFSSANTARSPAVAMSIAGSGYEKIRIARQGLRYRAFVLAVGQALLSGKGPTYRQDKALKKFADLLCSGITDREWAKACRDELLVLIDSKVDDTPSGLTRLVDQLTTEAYPELKKQLLGALIETTASRQKRTRESREFLEYCRTVLA